MALARPCRRALGGASFRPLRDSTKASMGNSFCSPQAPGAKPEGSIADAIGVWEPQARAHGE